MKDSDLDSNQLAAVLATDGAVVIAAGPGTGKTRVFAHRVAHLIRNKSVQPGEILAVSFTRSAASEMRERLSSLLPDTDLSDLWLETCHAAALRILRAEQYPFPNLAVADEDQRLELAAGIVPRGEAKAWLEKLRGAKQRLEWPQDEASRHYQEALRRRGLADFDDLFLFVLQLFDGRPEALELWRGRFRYVIMDEFQDTSLAQYRFISHLAGADFCVIGDPDQSIYGFANDGCGAERFEPFTQFAKDHQNRRTLALSENYRSQGIILDAAQQVIARNPAPLPRQLRARLERGLPIGISGHQSDRQEAEMVVRRIEDLLGGASRFTVDTGWARDEADSRSYGLSDIAILYRLNAQARLFELALERIGLPYVTYGKKTKKDGREVLAEEDLEDFRDNERAAPSLVHPAGESITLMTVHRAKGLEFPVVFLTGCEDGILPYRREGDDSPSPEEERRLFYVGMTRAGSRLLISYARKRFLFGKTLALGPSPFVADIEDELRRLEKSEALPRKRPKDKQPELF